MRIDDFITGFSLISGYLLLLGIGGLVADFLLPCVPFIKRYLENLPDWDEEINRKDMGEESFEIQQVSVKRLREIIHQMAPSGRFLAKEGRTWIAVDNSTNHAWTEEFRKKCQAVRWLRGEFEVSDSSQK